MTRSKCENSCETKWKEPCDKVWKTSAVGDLYESVAPREDFVRLFKSNSVAIDFACGTPRNCCTAHSRCDALHFIQEYGGLTVKELSDLWISGKHKNGILSRGVLAYVNKDDERRAEKLKGRASKTLSFLARTERHVVRIKVGQYKWTGPLAKQKPKVAKVINIDERRKFTASSTGVVEATRD